MAINQNKQTINGSKSKESKKPKKTNKNINGDKSKQTRNKL